MRYPEHRVSVKCFRQFHFWLISYFFSLNSNCCGHFMGILSWLCLGSLVATLWFQGKPQVLNWISGGMHMCRECGTIDLSRVIFVFLFIPVALWPLCPFAAIRMFSNWTSKKNKEKLTWIWQLLKVRVFLQINTAFSKGIQIQFQLCKKGQKTKPEENARDITKHAESRRPPKVKLAPTKKSV